MDFIQSKDGHEGVGAMAEAIIHALAEGEVLWLICGGSNIPLAKEAMDIVRANVSPEILARLTVGQTDERYGQPGHPDSNWKQMHDVQFNFDSVKTLPILLGKDLKQTAADYAVKLSEVLSRNPHIVAQFGMGADGHVAGMLPHTGGLDATELVFGYESEPFTRVSITPPVFEKIDEAFVFVFGTSKHEVVTKLWQKDLTIEEMPCQILKRVPECRFYSDQL